ncbi:MAG: DUF1616 domain-containing protein [Candidatus Bathyarchaeia archaeon]
MPKNQEPNESIKELIIRIVQEQKPETVRQLMRFVHETTDVSEKKIINLLNQLEDEDKIHLNLKQELASESIRTYLFTLESAWYWIIIALAIATMITVLTIPQVWYPFAYIRNVLGVIFVLFLPGFAFTKAFFPARLPIQTSSQSLDMFERFALSIGLSIALASIVGLILYYTPPGLGLTPIILSLLALTLVLATVAVAREYRAKSNTIQRIL